MITKRKVLHRPERDRAIHAVLQHLRGLKPSEIANKSGVSAQTISNWRRPVAQGGVRYPQFYTLNLVAQAYGKEFRLCDKGDSAHTRPASMNARSEGAAMKT